MSDDDFDGPDDGLGPDDGYEPIPLDVHEADLVRRDLADLGDLEAAFAPEGYRGVAVWCGDCMEEHYYPWSMLRENLTLLLETGETPVHEPAFAPEPDRYINWEYARGYVDAMQDAGVHERIELTTCARCHLPLEAVADANFCPRCGSPLLAARLLEALLSYGLSSEDAAAVVRQVGLPG